MLPFNRDSQWSYILNKDKEKVRKAAEEQFPEICNLEKQKQDDLIYNNWRLCHDHEVRTSKKDDKHGVCFKKRNASMRFSPRMR